MIGSLPVLGTGHPAGLVFTRTFGYFWSTGESPRAQCSRSKNESFVVGTGGHGLPCGLGLPSCPDGSVLGKLGIPVDVWWKQHEAKLVQFKQLDVNGR